MECNKEEAIRAMTVAEKKMETKDFLGAKKIALKARQLYPSLENISQMLSVCEVHCAASVQINGTIDWYGILQVDVTADESVIKKQYRKFALLLHPDKNKFAGAEAAFKLIVEANLTLADKGKRSIYDAKRNTFREVTSRPHPQAKNPYRNSYVWVHPSPSNNVNNYASTHMHRQKQMEARTTSLQTFWTICPFCAVKYQYYLSILNRNIHCQNCNRNFTAFEVKTQGSFTGMNQSSSQQGDAGFSNARFQGNTSVKPAVSVPATNVGTESGSKVKEDGQGGNSSANENKANFERVNLKDAKKRENIPEFQGNPKTKRRRTVAQSSESESSDSNEEIIEGSDHAKNVDTNVYHPRRSTRKKQNITYNENHTDNEEEINDDDFVSSLKQTKRNRRSRQPDDTDKKHLGSNMSGMHGHDLGVPECGTSSKVDFDSCEPDDLFSYADTEFYDFQKKRDATLFSNNQIWALYDDSDGMPRFYACIKQVTSPGFKVRYTWLEYNPVNEAEKEWSGKELPIGCGIFINGKTQSSKELSMFSHLMCWEKGPSKNTYLLYPRKGEIWALYKDWDIEWKSNPANHRSYKYEVVEVISDYAHDNGVLVARLLKVRGFVSLFARTINKEGDILQVSPNEMLKFSHLIPSYKMTGEEREGIPQGSYELDTASLPPDLDSNFPSFRFDPLNIKTEDKHTINLGPFSEASIDKNHEDLSEHLRSEDGDTLPNNVSGSCKEGLKYQEKKVCIESATAAFFEYADTEFYRFEAEKNPDKFQQGQIWALYSGTDGYPNYYALVTEVERDPFKVCLSWLEVCPMLAEERQWYKRNLRLGCGRFEPLPGRRNRETYDNVEVFSHKVKAVVVEKKNHYYIYPNTGEVWAVYKNWNANWEKCDCDECEYDLVEIISSTASVIEVKILEKVNGHYAVFKQMRGDDVSAPMEFPRDEWMRFSHCVPAFRLTEERGGKLRGYWELDPPSVPQDLLCASDS